MPFRYFSVVVVAVASVAVALLPGVVRADIFYVHADRGDDSRTEAEAGNPLTPWRTLSRVQNVLGNGDTVYGAGTFDSTLRRDDPLRDIQILQWPDEEPFVLRGSREVAPTTWLHHAGNCYRAGLAGIPDVRGVVVLYGDPERRDAFGRHKGWLLRATNLAACIAAPYTYYWDGVDGLYVNVNGANPSTDPKYVQYPVEYALGDLPAAVGLIDFFNVTNTVIRGVTFRMTIHKADTAYGLGMGGVDNLIENCVFEHNAWHGIVIGRYGALSKRTTMRGCLFRGFGDTTGTAHPNFATFYSGRDHVEDNIDEDNVYLCYGMLKYDGVPIDSTFHVHATYCHTSANGNYVRNHIRRRLIVRHFENPGTALFCGNQPDEMPSDDEEWDPEAYEIRHYDCVVYNGYTGNAVRNGAFVRCAFYMDNFGPNGGNRWCFGFDPGTSKCLFDACHISVNMYHPTLATNMFLLSQLSSTYRPRLLLRNTSILSAPGPNGFWQRVFLWAGSTPAGEVRARGCVIASLKDQQFTLAEGAASLDLARFDFEGNYYHGIAPTSWIRGSSSAGTTAQFQALIDPPVSAGGFATYGLNPGYIDATRSAEPTPGGNLDLAVVHQKNATTRGINGVLYSGHYGPWQTPCVADFNNDELANSTDFFHYVAAFFMLEQSADIDGSGAVDSQDFFAFLIAFFAGCD